MEIRRVIVIVLDSVGIGELPDAADFGDVGSHTLGNMARVVGGLNMPNMEKMGLGNIAILDGVVPQEKPTEVVATFSPYLWEHIKRFGEHIIDTEALPAPLQPDKPFLSPEMD